MPEFHEISVEEAAAQIRERTLSPAALVESLLRASTRGSATCRPGSLSTVTQ